MKDIPPEQPLADKDKSSERAPRRRKHSPKPNIATWLIIAWLAFMATWGGKHLYRQWAKAQDNIAMPAEIALNATGHGAPEPQSGLPASCPLK